VLQQRLEDNSSILEEYRKYMIRELNATPDYITNTFKLLKRIDLANASNETIMSFLDTLRKPEIIDPLHKWIGTHNLYLDGLKRFFKWYGKPEVTDGIKRYKRKEKSIYKPSDLWTVEDDLLFYKYCPSKKYCCYHAVSRDSSCRPSELLRVKVKDVMFKMAGNKQYAEILVSGKTGSRHIPLINSIPYLKDWLLNHPEKNNPNAYLFCRKGNKISSGGVRNQYKTRLRPYFASLKNIDSKDREAIKELLKKPWNPYLRRHSALTDKSKILKEHVLRQHAGWSISSRMPEKYLHYFGNESNEAILEAYGLKPKISEVDKMQPVQCPNCGEGNRVDSKFCGKCRMVLSYDAYSETVEEKDQVNDKIEELQSTVNKLAKTLIESGLFK
jgi:integrase/recombinase XerD